MLTPCVLGCIKGMSQRGRCLEDKTMALRKGTTEHRAATAKIDAARETFNVLRGTDTRGMDTDAVIAHRARVENAWSELDRLIIERDGQPRVSGFASRAGKRQAAEREQARRENMAAFLRRRK